MCTILFAAQAVLTYVFLPVLSEELKTAMRLLGATRVADLNMQHVSVFGQAFLLGQYEMFNAFC